MVGIDSASGGPPVSAPSVSAPSVSASSVSASSGRDQHRLATISYLPGAESVPVSVPVSRLFPPVDADLAAELLRIEKISTAALARRSLSSDELHALLVSKDVDDSLAADEVHRLERVGLLGDSEMAFDLVDRLRDRKNLGKSAIQAELKRRGIGQSDIDTAIEQHEFEPEDELARAAEVAAKRARQLGNLDYSTAERRLMGFLMRRGYSGSVARSATKAALDGVNPRSSSSVRFR